jgi:2-oxoglutarate dehydrogenase E2 component (dihydrolipoamide succinyltransferase)
MGMSDAEVVRWLVEDGGLVEEGADVVEVEAEKSTVLLPAPASGVLRIVAGPAEVVDVGGLLAVIEPPSAAA